VTIRITITAEVFLQVKVKLSLCFNRTLHHGGVLGEWSCVVKYKHVERHKHRVMETKEEQKVH